MSIISPIGRLYIILRVEVPMSYFFIGVGDERVVLIVCLRLTLNNGSTTLPSSFT